MLHTKLQCVRVVACKTSEITDTVNKLSFPNNWNSYGSRSSWRIVVIGSECLTKNTAVSQKCQQNVSKIAQRHEYMLPSAANSYLCHVTKFMTSSDSFQLTSNRIKYLYAFAQCFRQFLVKATTKIRKYVKELSLASHNRKQN